MFPAGVWASVDSDDIACDPSFLVAFCLSPTAFQDLKKLKLLSEDYNWSLKLTEALLAFSKWQVWQLEEVVVRSTGSP